MTRRSRKAATSNEITALLKQGWCLVLIRGYYYLVNRSNSIYANANSVRSVLKKTPDKWMVECWTDGPNFNS
jgi:hypothetical protein